MASREIQVYLTGVGDTMDPVQRWKNGEVKMKAG